MKIIGEGYDWKKTAVKLVLTFIYGGVGYLITYFAKLPEPAIIVPAIVAFLTTAQNFLKHRLDEGQ